MKKNKKLLILFLNSINPRWPYAQRWVSLPYFFFFFCSFVLFCPFFIDKNRKRIHDFMMRHYPIAGFVGNPNFIYFSWAVNWGVAYDLPNDTWIINHKNRKVFPKQIVQRRHRRDLYQHLETLMDK